MRRLDRYVLSEVLPAFVVGIGLFASVLVSFDLVYNALKLMVREHVPGLVVLDSVLYRMPGVVAMTLPMATMFACLTSVGRLCADGEITAMRAGGIGLPRIIRSMLGFGFCVALFGLGFNELVVPTCNWRSDTVLLREAQSTSRTNVRFESSGGDGIDREVRARLYDVARNQLLDVSIFEWRNGKFWQLFTADKAVWQGDTWVLYSVVHQWQPENGDRLTERVRTVKGRIGKSPEEILNLKKDTEDMTLPELMQMARKREKAEGSGQNSVLELIIEIDLRLAMPFSALGFALMAAPLGLRPQRTSKSIGFGLSIVIVFAYYIVFQIVRVVGEQGTLPPLAAAWTPNVVLFLIGAGLLMDKSR